jgi:hypothetical protein
MIGIRMNRKAITSKNLFIFLKVLRLQKLTILKTNNMNGRIQFKKRMLLFSFIGLIKYWLMV